MLLRLCISINAIISLVSFSYVMLRVIDGIYMGYKFFHENKINGVDIGSYSTFIYLNICIFGCLFSLFYFNFNKTLNKITLLFYLISLALIDISLLLGVFYFVDIR